MSWLELSQILGNTGEFVGAILLFVSLVFVGLQIRQNTMQQKLTASISVQHGQNSVIGLMQDPLLQRALARTGENGRAASIEDRARTFNWILQYLNHFQVVYDLYKDGTLDRERYEIWERFAVSMIAPQGILEWWNGESGKLAFTKEVRDFIDSRLENKADPPVPITELWSFFYAKSWE